jgi:hypothetical protein
MTALRFLVILQLVAALAFGQTANQSTAGHLSAGPDALVSSLYRNVVANHPLGIPRGTKMKVFRPYLTKALRDRIDAAWACSEDWLRRNSPPPIEKAPFAWPEEGLFSGPNERASPTDFRIERTVLEKDGSFRVYVRLALKDAPPEIWRVAAVVVQEGGRLVDDVIYLEDENNTFESRLSADLSAGCDGSHWIGNEAKKQN